jgi:hypothetical protein
MTEQREPLDELRRSPTVEAWEVELRRILSGDRAYLLVHHGSADGLVASIVTQSDDPVTSTVRMAEALDRVARELTWNEHSLDAVGLLLELIAAYRPPSGLPALLGALRDRGGVGRKPWLSFSDTDTRLTLKALTALNEYFPAPPYDDHSPAFRAYVEVLIDQLRHQDRAGVALVRLLELAIISPDHSLFKEVIETSPGALNSLVAWSSNPTHILRAPRVLSAAYAHCLLLPDGDLLFLDSLTRYGAAIGLSESSCIATLKSGARVELVQPQTQYLHMARWLQRQAEDGLKHFDEIVLSTG